jgi:hypothetical protein
VAGSCILLFGGVMIVARLARRALIVLSVPVALGYGLVLWWNTSHWPVNDVAVLALALVVGCIIGAALRSGVAVVAFCAAAAAADLVSFSGGFTRAISDAFRDGKSGILMHLSISFPVAGAVRPIVGIGDLVVATALFVALMRIGYGLWASFAVPLAGMILALGVGLLVGGAPALPFIAAVTGAYVLTRRPKTSSPPVAR